MSYFNVKMDITLDIISRSIPKGGPFVLNLSNGVNIVYTGFWESIFKTKKIKIIEYEGGYKFHVESMPDGRVKSAIISGGEFGSNGYELIGNNIKNEGGGEEDIIVYGVITKIDWKSNEKYILMDDREKIYYDGFWNVKVGEQINILCTKKDGMLYVKNKKNILIECPIEESQLNNVLEKGEVYDYTYEKIFRIISYLGIVQSNVGIMLGNIREATQTENINKSLVLWGVGMNDINYRYSWFEQVCKNDIKAKNDYARLALAWGSGVTTSLTNERHIIKIVSKYVNCEDLLKLGVFAYPGEIDETKIKQKDYPLILTPVSFQLNMLGIPEKHHKKIKKHSDGLEDSDIPISIINNPYAWYDISILKCDEIAKMTGREMKLEKFCGIFQRKVIQLQKEQKWTCIPCVNLDKIFSGWKQHVEFMEKNYGIVSKGDYIYTKKSWKEEQRVIDFVIERKDEMNKIMGEIEYEINLTDEQKRGLYLAISCRLSIITGRAGTGKTTVLINLISNLQRMGKYFFVLAPTGKAVQRIKDMLPFPDTQDFTRTIHSFLTTPLKDNKNIPEYLIIDECSMIDLGLMAKFIEVCEMIGNGITTVLCGDFNQLPPLRYGRPFEDCIKSGVIKTAELTLNQRSNDGIIINSHNVLNAIKEKYMPTLSETFDVVSTDDWKSFFSRKLIGLKVSDFYKNIKILAPTNNMVLNVNKYVSSMVNNGRTSVNIKTSEYEFMKYTINDPVLFTKNNMYVYDHINHIKGIDCPGCKVNKIYNGTEGIITEINHRDGYMKISIEDKVTVVPLIGAGAMPGRKGEKFFYVKNVVLAYAVTVHKSQGSEWKRIFCIVDGGASSNFRNNRMMYTAITRASTECTIINISDYNDFVNCCSTDQMIHHGNLLTTLNEVNDVLLWEAMPIKEHPFRCT